MRSNIAAKNLDVNLMPIVEDDVYVCTEGVITTHQNNLIGVGNLATNPFVSGQNYDLVGTSSDPLDPDLGVLRDNGGKTLTMALLSNSPAIGTGSNPLGAPSDQRGERYFRETNFLTDIGAYQTQRSRRDCCPQDRPCSPDHCRDEHP